MCASVLAVCMELQMDVGAGKWNSGYFKVQPKPFIFEVYLHAK